MSYDTQKCKCIKWHMQTQLAEKSFLSSNEKFSEIRYLCDFDKL